MTTVPHLDGMAALTGATDAPNTGPQPTMRILTQRKHIAQGVTIGDHAAYRIGIVCTKPPAPSSKPQLPFAIL